MMRHASKAALVAALIPFGLHSHAAAQVPVYETDRVTLSAGLDAGFAFFQTYNTNFGAGVMGNTSEKDASYNEWFLKPKFTGELRFGESGQKLYAGASFVGSMTFDDGDPTGLTSGEPEDLDWDDFYLGYNTGTLTSSRFGQYDIDVSFGRQPFKIGDSFLIGDGHFDQGEEGTYWLSPRDAFDNSFIIKLNTEPARADLFYIKGDTDQAETEIVGLNLEYIDPQERGTIGTYYLQAVDSDALQFNALNPDARDGLKTLSVRAQGNPFTSAPDLFLSSEFAYQWNNRSANEVAAHAYYAEVGYTFSDFAWKPTLSYRYASYTGDDLGTNQNEGFDPLFYGYSRGWGTWFQGEVVGEYLIFNSNVNLHMLHANFKPHEDWQVGAQYWRFDRDQAVTNTSQAGHYADELDVYADWYTTDWLTLSAYYAAAFPGDAASSENNGFDETYQVLQFIAYVSF